MIKLFSKYIFFYLEWQLNIFRKVVSYNTKRAEASFSRKGNLVLKTTSNRDGRYILIKHRRGYARVRLRNERIYSFASPIRYVRMLTSLLLIKQGSHCTKNFTRKHNQSILVRFLRGFILDSQTNSTSLQMFLTFLHILYILWVFLVDI